MMVSLRPLFVLSVFKFCDDSAKLSGFGKVMHGMAVVCPWIAQALALWL
jgi:hypothetical protein